MRPACTILSCLLAVSVSANDFWVDGTTSGSDANPGTADAPFRTIQKALDSTANDRGDVVYVLPGVYAESAAIMHIGVALIGVGEGVIIQDRPVGLTVNQGSIVRNLVFRNCLYGLDTSGSQNLVVRACRFQENTFGLGNRTDFQSNTMRIERCDFFANNAVGAHLFGTRFTIERCTFTGNARATYVAAGSVLIRNCIVAFNTFSGLYNVNVPAHVTSEFNCVFQNGAGEDYVNVTPGATDIAVDPQFIEPSRFNFALKASSPVLNAGRDASGLPVTLGAHEIGVLSSASPEATHPFASWTDAAGTPVTDPTAQVVLGPDGFLRLNGTQRAAVLSPVIDLGEAGATITQATYRAIEDTSRPSGSKRVVDQDDATYSREIRLRAADTPFGALDANPPWQTTTANADLSVRGQWTQIEIVLTLQGR